MSSNPIQPIQLDVRPIVPREKHMRIFQLFDSLQSGESFILINDHNPTPLRYQFDAERKEQYNWNFLEQGPEVWRVQIGKN